MPERHPEPARLLALLDGEAGWLEAWRLRRHLERCWTCRARSVGLEQAIAAAAATVGRPDRLGVARARWQFREAAGRVDAALVGGQRAPWLRRAPWAALALAALVIGFWWRQPPPVSTLGQVRPPTSTPPGFDTVERTEAGVITAVREDTFLVTLSGVGKPPAARRWTVLSAPRSGLYSSRWAYPAGEVREAVFVAGGQAEAYTPMAGVTEPVARATARPIALPEALAALRSPTLATVESAVVAWLRQQAWEPVSLTREAARFRAGPGATAEVRRDGHEWLWIAERRLGAVRMRVTLCAADRQPPRLLEIAWHEDGGPESRIQFRREHRREYPLLTAAPAWLRVDAVRRTAHRPTEEPGRTPAPREPREVLGAEVEAVAALHRLGIWQRDLVKVSAGGHVVRVTGWLAHDSERQKVQTTLAGLPRAALVEQEWRVPDLDGESTTAPAALAAGAQRSHPAPGEAWLRQRLSPRLAERELFTQMSLLVSAAQDLMSAASALEALAEQFPAAREASLAATDRDLLHATAHGHAVATFRHLAQLRTTLGSTASEPARLAGPWQDHARRFRVDAWRAGDLALRLFSSSDREGLGARTPEEAGLPALLGQLDACWHSGFAALVEAPRL